MFSVSLKASQIYTQPYYFESNDDSYSTQEKLMSGPSSFLGVSKLGTGIVYSGLKWKRGIKFFYGKYL